MKRKRTNSEKVGTGSREWEQGVPDRKTTPLEEGNTRREGKAEFKFLSQVRGIACLKIPAAVSPGRRLSSNVV
ncbi:hypothetical protein RUM44_003558 [Polyplax serrata]|uniref:Uncharacterized protein n=1 Tax=Polyplax serrata TaxID=468196 RepID=A0ABR1AGS5_POLSC